MRILIISLLFIGLSNSYGSFELNSPSACQFSLGNTISISTSLSSDFPNHPALLTNATMHASFSKKILYNITLLQNHGISYTFITRMGGFGITGYQFGNSKYNETTLSLGWGHHFFDKLDIGLLLNWHQLAITNYGNTHQWTINFSTNAKITSSWQWILAIQNIGRYKIGQTQDELPSAMILGNAYTLNPYFKFAMEYFTDRHFPAEVRIGLQIKVSPFLHLRSGYTQSPETFSCGFGFKGFGFCLDYGMQSHRTLGISHCFTITI